jgi:hypothetical protein
MSYQTVLQPETDEEMVTCDNCGNIWDGYAQCYCNGISDYDSVADEEPESDITRSTHQMTLRSHTKLNEVIIEYETELYPEPVHHPECWNEHTHYGQCGQSCPCCRAIVGDEWGACLVCSKH